MSEVDPQVTEAAGADPPARRRWRRVAIIAALSLLLLGLLFVSLAPSVPLRSPPTAESVHAAREAAHQFANRRSRLAMVTLDNNALAGLSSIASDASHLKRLDAHIVDQKFVGSASLRLPIAGWINGSVAIAGDQRGFPHLETRIGRVTLPGWASRLGAELGRLLLRRRGVELPPLDEMVRRIRVEPQRLVAEVTLPTESGLVGGLIGIQGNQADGAAVAALYCQLVDLQQRVPDPTLAGQLRRAFINAPAGEAVQRNRTIFLAVAMLTVGDRVTDLAPAAGRPSLRCGSPQAPVRLDQRTDLAMHWSLSAALASTLGTVAARAMGEWKELDDSMPDGSGFSFVDLSADRSGVHAARLGADPATAAELARRMTTITDSQLLPIAALAQSDGLTEQEFLARYGTIKSDRYKATVAWIDHMLGSVG